MWGRNRGAVITCPAWFRTSDCAFLREACEMVTLSNEKPLRFLKSLPEPIAAAIAYRMTFCEDTEKTVLVYDLGGGTLDVAVVKMNCGGDKRNLQIVTIDGDHQLGGKDWDTALGNCVRGKFFELAECDYSAVEDDLTLFCCYSEQIELAKIDLALKESVTLPLTFDGYREKIEIKRDFFEVETEHLLNRTVFLLDDMIEKSGLSMENDIDEIILVGGATRMPQVMRRLRMKYQKPILSFEPEFAVVKGAAIIANNINLP